MSGSSFLRDYQKRNQLAKLQTKRLPDTGAASTYLARIERKQKSQAEKERALKCTSLTDLHKEILGWEIASLGTSVKKELRKRMRPVPARFDGDEAEYQEIFQPLLLEETRASLQNSLAELEARSYDDADTAKTHQSGFNYVKVGSYTQERHFAFIQLTLNKSSMVKLGTHDLVLLWLRPKRKSGSSAAEWLSSDCTTLACLEKNVTEKRSADGSLGINRTTGKLEYRAKVVIPPGSARSSKLNRYLFSNGSEWGCIKVENLKTLHREFLALQSCAHLPLFPLLLKPDRRGSDKPKGTLEHSYRNTVFRHLNDGQYDVVKAAMDDAPLTLIQGPPGTGKTTTIVAMVNAVLLRSREQLKACGYQVCARAIAV